MPPENGDRIGPYYYYVIDGWRVMGEYPLGWIYPVLAVD